MSDIGKRVNSLEVKLARIEGAKRANKIWATIFGVVVLGWLGVSTFVQVPKAIESALKEKGVMAAKDRIKSLKTKAEDSFGKIENLRKKAVKVSGEIDRKSKEIHDDLNNIVKKDDLINFQNEIRKKLSSKNGISILKYKIIERPTTPLSKVARGKAYWMRIEDEVKISTESIIIISTYATGDFKIKPDIYTTMISKIFIDEKMYARDNSSFMGGKSSPKHTELFTSTTYIKELVPRSRNYRLGVEAAYRGDFYAKNPKIFMQYVIIGKED